MKYIDLFTLLVFTVYIFIVLIIYLRPNRLGGTMRLFLRRRIVQWSVFFPISYVFLLYFLYTYQYEHIELYDGLLQITGEIIGIVFGLFLAFYYDRTHEHIQYIAEILRIIDALNIELNNNVEILNKCFAGRANYNFYWHLLQTTTWEIFKERLYKAPGNLLRVLIELYYYINVLNNVKTPKNHIKTDEFVQLQSIADNIKELYTTWKKESLIAIDTMFENEV